MHSKATIALKVLKLLALAERPGTIAEGEAARAAAAGLMKEYGISDDDLRLRSDVEAAIRGIDHAAERERVRRGFNRTDTGRPIAGVSAELDHATHPNRVHLAYDWMTSVCGIGPTFVWTAEREKLIGFDDPCPHCLASGVIDTRRERKRLGPA